MSGSGVERCGLQATADRAVTLPRRSRGPGSVLLFIISNIHKISPPLTHAIGRQYALQTLSSVPCSSAASVHMNSRPSYVSTLSLRPSRSCDSFETFRRCLTTASECFQQTRFETLSIGMQCK